MAGEYIPASMADEHREEACGLRAGCGHLTVLKMPNAPSFSRAPKSGTTSVRYPGGSRLRRHDAFCFSICLRRRSSCSLSSDEEMNIFFRSTG
jgi:hypothetical protein